MIKNYKKWFLPFILLFVLYACTSEQDYRTDDEQKQIDPLTVSTAQALYEQYVGKTSRVKSADEGSAIEFMPDWSQGELFSDSLWYVVESPLKMDEGQTIRFMTEQVREYSETKNVLPKQVFRQVVMRNKQTGLDYAFMMVVMPGLDYMLSKGDELEKNRYLTRESDLSGTVIFYTTDGEFVNGWVYEEGKIAYSIGELKNRLKNVETGITCWYQHFYGISQETGDITYIGSNVHCETIYSYDHPIAIDDNGSGGVDPGGGVGIGGGSGSPSIPPTPDPPKEEPTDPCKSMSNKMASQEFMNKITELKNLTGQKYEAGRSYTYKDGMYNFTNHDGSTGIGEIEYSPSYISKIDGFIHSHYDGLLKTFSASDLMIPYHWFINKNGINNLNTFSLGLVTSEGTYFLFISDWTKYRAFGQTYENKEVFNILSGLYENDYNIKPSTDATTSMNNLANLLENTNSGLTLMKDAGNNKFSIVTKDSQGNIKLINCN